ncbi:hypothetical protein [Flavobacterium sp. TAB 87]|uniref:hypothetical protein n=1 Tax=Flavobacterium sp. TAB 87 TaxID=1729581 RepID=UPI00076DB088|nr:hypothetical protein [Flavobacterium sp. TAB 87]KVV16355.1 hypothetical protein AP058_00107 [Flavobacterium sp. TAB 87]
MKLVIDRTLFGFNDGIDTINQLNDKFTFLSILLNRLLSEKYTGKKIKYLNLFFYENPIKLIKAYGKDYFLHYYGGQFTYKRVIDYDFFLSLNYDGQKQFIWKTAYEMLQFAAEELKNESLLNASEYAYHKGLEMELNADYRMIETEVIIFGKNYKAAVWVNFLVDKMQANFTLEKNNQIVLKKLLEEGPNGMEFFLVMFKKILQKDNSIIIHGTKDLAYLPLQVSFINDHGQLSINN